MHILIVGGGNMGREIAKSLSADNEVVVIEKDPEIAEKDIEDIDGLVIRGDGTQLEILEQAGIDNTDLVLAMTNNDETNLLIGVTAKQKEKEVFARVRDPTHIGQFERMKIDKVIIPERYAAVTMVERIKDVVKDEKARILIVGGGTMCRELVNALHKFRNNIVIIEKDAAVSEKTIQETHKLVITGDGTRMWMLERAGIDHADLVAAITDNDGVNLLVDEIAREKGKKVIARARELEHKELFEKLGIENTINIETLAAQSIAEEIRKKQWNEKEKKKEKT